MDVGRREEGVDVLLTRLSATKCIFPPLHCISLLPYIRNHKCGCFALLNHWKLNLICEQVYQKFISGQTDQRAHLRQIYVHT